MGGGNSPSPLDEWRPGDGLGVATASALSKPRSVARSLAELGVRAPRGGLEAALSRCANGQVRLQSDPPGLWGRRGGGGAVPARRWKQQARGSAQPALPGGSGGSARKVAPSPASQVGRRRDAPLHSAPLPSPAPPGKSRPPLAGRPAGRSPPPRPAPCRPAPPRAKVPLPAGRAAFCGRFG